LPWPLSPCESRECPKSTLGDGGESLNLKGLDPVEAWGLKRVFKKRKVQKEGGDPPFGGRRIISAS